MELLLEWFRMGLGASIGAILGSFANVCIYRVPRGKSVVQPRSRCPRCHSAILWYQNIPIMSYFFLGGVCSHCRSSISFRYVLVEVGMAGLFGIVFVRNPIGSQLVLGGVLTFVLTVIAVIDLDFRIIPDVFSFGLLWMSLAVSPINSILGLVGIERVINSFLGAGVGFFTAWLMAELGRRLFHREALGGGDVKLLAGLGAFLGWRGVLTTWFLASILGSLVFVWLKSRKKMEWGAYLPFGPFLAAGAWAHWTWPDFFSRLWGF